MAEQIKKFSPEEIKKQIADWASDWNDTYLKTKILQELREFSKLSGLSISDLKSLINQSLKIKGEETEKKAEKEEGK